MLDELRKKFIQLKNPQDEIKFLAKLSPNFLYTDQQNLTKVKFIEVKGCEVNLSIAFIKNITHDINTADHIYYQLQTNSKIIKGLVELLILTMNYTENVDDFTINDFLAEFKFKQLSQTRIKTLENIIKLYQNFKLNYRR